MQATIVFTRSPLFSRSAVSAPISVSSNSFFKNSTSAYFGFLLLTLRLTTAARDAVTPPVRNITGKTVPYVIPADAANTNFSLVVEGTNFGSSRNQPNDLICRVKAADYLSPQTGAVGPAYVLNTTHIQCMLGRNYLTTGPIYVHISYSSLIGIV